MNDTEYYITSNTTNIPIIVGTEVTITTNTTRIKTYSSSNTEYIPGDSAFPITFTMPNEDMWFTIYDTSVPV